jgi:RHS repeat-associated protein
LNDTFVYDAASRLSSAVSARFSTTVTRTYASVTEKAGRLVNETQTVGGFPYTVGYGYSVDNLVTTITYPTTKQVVRAYDARHLLTGVGYDDPTPATTPNLITRQYDTGGRQTTTAFANGLTDTQTYDAVKKEWLIATKAVPGVTNFSYTYDANKRKLTEGHFIAGDAQSFSAYDHENRLTGWSRTGGDTQSWVLSLVGDWQSTTRNGTAETRTHSPVHETLTSTIGAATAYLDYDTKGNLTVDQAGQRYGWDQENRLIAARAGASSSGYLYDALGRRLGKTALGVTTTYVHDGAQVIAEYEAPALQSSAIGAPALPGAFSDDGQGTVTQSAGGTDIGGTTDQFRYAYATLIGNGSIVVRVTSQTNTDAWAKAGVMLRESLAANARTAALLLSPTSGVTFQRRSSTGGATTSTIQAGVAGPVWLRLTRTGSTVTAERSTDGLAWTLVGTDATVGLPTGTPIYVGLAVTSHNVAAASTVTFTNAVTTGNVRTTASPVYARGYVYGTYVDELLAILPASGLEADRKFVHSNHLYSVAALTGNTGTVLERYRYDAYGQRTSTAPDGVTVRPASLHGNQYGFTGRYLDKETGLWYFRARHYSGSLGRFIGRDPIGYAGGGMGLYAAYFIPNNLDSSGMYPDPNPPDEICDDERPCCCCVDDLTIKNLTRQVVNGLETFNFDAGIALSYIKHKEKKDCVLKWVETN